MDKYAWKYGEESPPCSQKYELRERHCYKDSGGFTEGLEVWLIDMQLSNALWP